MIYEGLSTSTLWKHGQTVHRSELIDKLGNIKIEKGDNQINKINRPYKTINY